jgi:hypothetical protein
MRDALDLVLTENKLHFDHTQNQKIDPALSWLFKHPTKKIDRTRLESLQMADTIVYAKRKSPVQQSPSKRKQYELYSRNEADSLT